MRILNLFRRNKSEDREARGLTLRDADGWADLTGTRTRAGVTITPETALGHPAVLGAVRLLAELTASLPIITYERTPSGRRRAVKHPVYRLLHDEPNPIQTPFVFKETIVLHLLTYGRAPVQVVRDGGRPVALWPLHPSRVTLDTTGGAFAYKVASPEGTRVFSPSDIVDVTMLAFDGLNGRAPIQLAREAIGAALAAEELAADYFANNAQPSGILQHPGRLTPEAAQRLKQSWQAAHGGRGRQGTAVLEEGTEFKPVSATAAEAQLLEARQYAMRAVAAAMRIPPHLLDPTVRGAYANVETQSIELLTFTLQPLLTRIEQAFQRRLFTPEEPFYAEFLVDGLLRSDTLNRFTAYQTAIFSGWMDPEEVRQRENLPPRPRRQQRSEKAPLETRTVSDRAKVQAEIERSLEAAFRQVLTREGREVLELVKRFVGNRTDPAQISALLREFYEKSTWLSEWMLRPFMEAAEAGARLGSQEAVQATELGMLPPMESKIQKQAVEAAKGRVARELLSDAIKEHVGISETEILSAVRSSTNDAELIDAVEKAIARWGQVRPGKAAALHATIIRNEAALEVFREMGATRLRWVASSDACSFCQELDGKVVGVGEPFVGMGEELAGPGGRMDRKMVARYPRVRPPVHLGCRCSIEIDG